MKMENVRDIQRKLREKYSQWELPPKVLCDIIHILFEYVEDQPERLSPEDAKCVSDSPNSENKESPRV